MIQATLQSSPRVLQGDLFRDIEYIEYAEERSGSVEISKIVYPLVLVLTQDCDLEQDHTFRTDGTKSNQDKYLLSVLVAPLYNAEHVYLGEHLSELGLKMAAMKKKGTEVGYLQNNQRPRYHYLEFPAGLPIADSVIDFKHYFSVSVRLLEACRSTQYVCSIDPLYRENVAQRFASFLARIGLPDQY